MNLNDFLRLATAFSHLGAAIQEQATYFADGGREGDMLNTNALRHIEGLLEDVERAADGDSTLADDCAEVIFAIREYVGD